MDNFQHRLFLTTFWAAFDSSWKVFIKMVKKHNRQTIFKKITLILGGFRNWLFLTTFRSGFYSSWPDLRRSFSKSITDGWHSKKLTLILGSFRNWLFLTTFWVVFDSSWRDLNRSFSKSIYAERLSFEHKKLAENAPFKINKRKTGYSW